MKTCDSLRKPRSNYRPYGSSLQRCSLKSDRRLAEAPQETDPLPPLRLNLNRLVGVCSVSKATIGPFGPQANSLALLLQPAGVSRTQSPQLLMLQDSNLPDSVQHGTSVCRVSSNEKTLRPSFVGKLATGSNALASWMAICSKQSHEGQVTEYRPEIRLQLGIGTYSKNGGEN